MTRFRVKAHAGNWGVFRNGNATPIAIFRDRTDAIKYANDIAETEPGVAEVVVELV